MKITVRAVSLNEQPITQPIATVFTAQGGSIGRADTNQLTLPDPERRISRRQAEIAFEGKCFVIRNVGSANPIIVREQSLALGESAPLRERDQVRIGGYLLEVTRELDEADDSTTLDAAPPASIDPFFTGAASASPWQSPSAGSSPRPAAALSSAAPFADLSANVSAANPFAELLGDSGAMSATPAHARSAPAPNRLPDDFDPFAPPVPPPAAAPRQSPTSGGGAFGDLIPSTESASIDALFGLTPSSSSSDPLAAFMAGASSTTDRRAGSSTPPAIDDPLAMFANARQPAAPAASALPDHTPELRAGFVPPRPAAARAAPAGEPSAAPSIAAARAERRAAPSLASRVAAARDTAHADSPTAAAPPLRSEEATVPPASGWSEDALAVWSYLCEGAGVRLDPPPNTGPAFMRVVGMMLRAAVEGTVQQMALRQATRQELQAQVTVIRPKNNNPLKFAPDGQSAMEQVLQPAVRGFLPGPAAMTDAMNDLLGHAIGTMAGTRAALEGVLKRFSPQELEAKLADTSVLDSLLPMNRRSKLWELYLQHYESIRDEAQDDFHKLFGRAFLAAYEQQLERLRREKAAGAAPK